MGSIVSCFGLRVGVRTNAPDLWPRIVDRLPVESVPESGSAARFVYSLWAGPPPPRRGVRLMSVLYRNSARLARTPRPDEMLAEFESDLLWIAAKWSPLCTFLPAAGVRVDGRAVLFACSDPQLEDRLVDELIRQGGARCARDYAPLDREGRLLPSMARRAVDGPPSTVASESLPVGVVALVDLVEEGAARLERLGPALATVELVSLATTVAGPPASRLATLAALTRQATVVRVRRADPAAAAAELLSLLAGRDSPA